MRLREQEFCSIKPEDWCWPSHNEILKIVSATETTIVYRLYQPAHCLDLIDDRANQEMHVRCDRVGFDAESLAATAWSQSLSAQIQHGNHE